MMAVGVFRDAALATVADLTTLLNLDAVQLHGHEDADYVSALRSELPRSCEMWTALSVGRDSRASRAGDRILFDNADGGSGQSFDWSLIREHSELPRAIVAGGIGPHNARPARDLGAYAIDVGSSVDERPGRKSPEKIAALFEALRAPSRQRLRACA